jgi:hypothetical protein
LLKQHNFVDWMATLPIVLIVWWWMGFSKLPQIFCKWFRLLNVKLGIQLPTNNIHTLRYDSRKPSKYYLKLIILWIVFVLFTLYLIIIVWNHSFGGFFGAKVPYIVISYIQPTYNNNGSSALPGYDTWKKWWV